MSKFDDDMAKITDAYGTIRTVDKFGVPQTTQREREESVLSFSSSVTGLVDRTVGVASPPQDLRLSEEPATADNRSTSDLSKDSGERFLDELDKIAQEDSAGLKKAAESYGNSWKRRGGIGAWMMMCRKFDRLEIRVEKMGWDIFRAIAEDTRSEGAIDDVRDLRRYLMLVEAEMRARGFQREHRDNK